MIVQWNRRVRENRRRGGTALSSLVGLKVLCISGVACLLLAMSGCATPKLEDDPAIKARTEGLDRIDTVRLEEKSVTKPVTVEQASSQIGAVIMEPNTTEPVIELTIEQVRAAALANNLDLKVELINPSIAEKMLDAERAKFESAFFGSAQYGRSDTTDSDTISRSHAYDLGWSQPLRTGGTLSLDTGAVDSEWNDAEGVADATASVSVVQSLLRGAGTRMNTHSIRIAAYDKHIVDTQTKLNAIYYLASADITYWNLYAALRELGVRRQQYDLAQDQLEHARRKVASRSAAKIEIVYAEAGLASRLDNLIRAEATVSDRQRDLKRIMNRADVPTNSDTIIRTATMPSPLGLMLDAEALADTAIENRMEMVLFALRLGIDEMNIDLARNATLPELALEYRYGAGRLSGSLGNAMGHLGDDPSSSHVLGLSATIPVGNRVARARLQQARLRRLQRRISEKDLKEEIRKQVYTAVNQLEQNWRSIQAAEQGVKAADRNLRVEQGQFKLGRRTSTDVLLSATNLADAKLRRIRAFVEYEVAQISLARATGTLLGHGRIQLELIDIKSG